jgi:succinate dehydrogenase / fumarate reductase flavoprotein subunit/L-aspartate oxidase
MGNALLDIISFGRKAGQKASEFNNGSHYKRSGIEHLTRWRRKLIEKSMSLDIKSPLLFPKMANFKLKL